MRLPKEGDFITIQSYKHDGSLHRTWRDTMVLKTTENALIGVNDHTLVTENDGRRWVTREPAIVYFHKKYWFNIIAMIRETGVSYYCNLASPYILDPEALKYIDYDLDVKVFADGEKRLLDVDEYEQHKAQMNYPTDIDYILKENVKILVEWINENKGPFSSSYINIW
ncbi:TPA: nucleoside tri-diphosphate phosphatase, partial [Streptococcus agalactiae]